MPRKYIMSWEGAPNFRWVKMYRGRRYRVTCDDLRAPRTKEDSYLQANAWWQEQLTKLAVREYEPEQREQLEALGRKLDWAANHDPQLLPQLENTKTQIEAFPSETVLDDAGIIAENVRVAGLFGIQVPPDLEPEVLQTLFGNRRLWQERLSRHRRTEKDKTVGYQLGRFLDEQRTRQKPQTFRELRLYLNHTLTTEVWSADTSVDNIDEQTVLRHYGWLAKHNYSPNRHNKVLGFFRRFVEWLYTSGLLKERPRNLKLKSHRRKQLHRQIRTYTSAHVKRTVLALPYPKRTWALLGLNCGMTNADLGTAGWDMIDTDEWTLIRRRVKTGDIPQVPTVRYKLWPETIEALQQLPHRKGLLFTTDSGTPMVETRYDASGAPKIKDMFASKWQRTDPKPEIPLSKFRNIAATALKEHEIFRSFVDYFLANAPETVSDRHYAAESDAPFFRATDFIRTSLGF